MFATVYQNTKPIDYSPSLLQRAERSLICSPFKLGLFIKMSEERVSIGEITGTDGIINDFTSKPMSELVVDNGLVWLIQVGIVRREVDGQGITDSFRLTPLGKQLVIQMEGKKLRKPTWRDRLSNFLTRWLRIPF